jgi:1-acyl-sn-glycerol-3-phosphate acyltransferase
MNALLGLCLFLGFWAGLVFVVLRMATPPQVRGNGMVRMNALVVLQTALLALLLLAAIPAQRILLAGLAGLAALAAWVWLFGRTIEVLAELLLVPMYRIRAHGPSKDHLPRNGPLIVVANHSSYLDPFWVAKLFPGQLRPLMTSAFFDLHGIRWLMVHVVQAIRVPLGEARRLAEAPADNAGASTAQRLPELREAIVALRQGACLLIFPEGMLRRKEDELLRQFGQGIWHILHELPDTPVLPVWIEGGWGSWASYRDGPPTKNKPLDWRRPIDIVFGEARPLPEAVLAQHRSTRAYLMAACLKCRRHLGLTDPAAPAEISEQEAEQNGTFSGSSHEKNP